MESWTNIHSIMRDLSMVQGHDVPIDVVAAVAPGDKPPAPHIQEDTEEEYYNSYICEEEINSGPDLSLIQHMLDMVREDPSIGTPSPTEHIGNGDVISTESSNSEAVTPKVKKKRNAAIVSILKMSKHNNDEVITKKEEIMFEPMMSMFKKKNVSDKPDQGGSSRSSHKEVNTFKTHSHSTYTPSKEASEYYKKFVERKKIQDSLNDDVWTLAEKKMKEIDERRKREQELAAMWSPPLEPNGPEFELGDKLDSAKLDVVRLPQYRHRLSGPCVVCKVLCKHDPHN